MIVSPARQTFRQSRTAAILSAIVAASVAAVVFAAAGDKEMRPAIAMVVGAGLIVIAVLLAMGRTVLTIHDEGVRRKSIFGTKELEWRQIREYRYMELPAQVGSMAGYPAAGLARGAISANLYLTLVGVDGVKISVTSSFKAAYEAIGIILSTLHARMRVNVDSEVASTGAVFGPLRITTRELQWKGDDPVPLGELSRAEIAGMLLRIKKKGKMLSLVAVRSNRVPNVLLLIETLEKLGVAGMARPLPQVRA